MSFFKTKDFNVRPESEVTSKDIKVTEVDKAPKPVIKDFQMTELKRPGAGSYQFTRSKYGPLAATDSRPVHKSTKDSRFNLNSIMKESLLINQEEDRVIEERVNARVQELADIATRKAEASGYEEGLKKGLDEALKKMQSESQVQVKRLDGLVSEFENAKMEIYRTNEKFLIDLVYRISRMILLKELEMDEEHLSRLTHELVGSMNARENITIKISAEDEKRIAALKGSLEKAFGELRNLQIVPSNQVQKGGCQIETELHAIDVDLETQFNRIYDSIMGKTPGGDA